MAELKKIDDQIITRQIPIRKLSDWGWGKNFNTLEEAAQKLLFGDSFDPEDRVLELQLMRRFPGNS